MVTVLPGSWKIPSSNLWKVNNNDDEKRFEACTSTSTRRMRAMRGAASEAAAAGARNAMARAARAAAGASRPSRQTPERPRSSAGGVGSRRPAAAAARASRATSSAARGVHLWSPARDVTNRLKNTGGSVIYSSSAPRALRYARRADRSGRYVYSLCVRRSACRTLRECKEAYKLPGYCKQENPFSTPLAIARTKWVATSVSDTESVNKWRKSSFGASASAAADWPLLLWPLLLLVATPKVEQPSRVWLLVSGAWDGAAAAGADNANADMNGMASAAESVCSATGTASRRPLSTSISSRRSAATCSPSRCTSPSILRLAPCVTPRAASHSSLSASSSAREQQPYVQQETRATSYRPED